MNKIFGILKQSWFLTLLGIIALSVIIWFLGPLFGFGGSQPLGTELSRYITIAILFVLWGLTYLWKAFRARQKNKQMLEQLSEETEPSLSPGEQATQDEVEHLDSRLQEAMQALQGLKLGDDKSGKDKQYLYQLPWYIIIGPPGSGKTTLLGNSDLQFPLSDKFGKDALHGVGGTKNCDWWFTNDAVLLDTAGRYVTQDSNKEVDQGAWTGFLDLLKKYRGHQPVNGVIIAVSIADMMQLSEDERSKHAKAIRNRIAELYEHLNISIPVYMMFTKSDLVAGFSEFFDDLNKEEREQVWGMTFPLSESANVNTIDMFNGEFTLLEQRVHQQLLQKLDHERNLDRRQSMYLFPQQFSSLKKRVNSFLTEVFHSSNFHKPLVLRGVYFTSATQEGSPIDRIMGSLASSFGIARQQLASFSGNGKSFFINRLLKQVIFSEAGLAGTNRKLEQKLQWVQTGIGVGVGVASLVIAGLWFNSYQANKTIISEYQQEVDEVGAILASSPNTGTLTDQLPLLNRMRQLTYTYTDSEEKPSLFSRLGLFQGRSIGEQADDKYRDFLRTIIRPHAKKNLESFLQKNLDNPTSLFGVLKTYLYLGGKAPKGTPSVNISGVDWNNNGQSNDKDDVALSVHFNALLKQPPSKPIEMDMGLIEKARIALTENPAKLAYIQLINSSMNSENIPDFRISDKEGLSSISSSFERKSGNNWLTGIPGLYTKAGFSQLFLPKYNDIVRNLKQDSWVLGPHKQIYQDTQSIKKTILQLYQNDFINHWSGFLQDLQIKSVTNTSQASEILRPLTADKENLLTKILLAVQSETDFSNEIKLPLIGDSIQLKKTLKTVDTHFKPLHQVVEKDQLKDTLRLIDDLYKGLYQDIAGGKEISGKVKTTLSELNAAIDKLPKILRDWLIKPIHDVNNIVGAEVIKGATNELVATASEELCTPCKAHFKNKYPFKQNAKKSVDIANFTEFFSLGGTADIFAKNTLKDSEDINPATIKSVNKFILEANRIRSVFFSTGNLSISYTVQLIQANPDVQSIQLAMGSTKNNFSPGAGVKPKEVYIWPASPITGVVTFTNPATPPKRVTITDAIDQWGLFKLVRNNQIRIPQLGNAVFAVQAPTLKENPFLLFKKLGKSLKQCRCPT